jgi:hypothetical protein
MRQKPRGAVATEVKGFTPLITSIVKAHGIYCAAVFGRMWRYCQMEDRVCRASQDTIANDLGISRATVNQHIDTLVKNGYLEDMTPNLRNAPHTYRDSGKVVLRSTFDAVEVISPENGVKILDSETGVGVKHFDTGVKMIDSGCQNDLHPGVKHFDMKKDSLRESLRNKESDSPANHLWQMINQQLCSEMRIGDYRQWVQPIQPVSYQDGVLTLRTQDQFGRDWCESRLGTQVTRLATALAGAETHVVFELETHA